MRARIDSVNERIRAADLFPRIRDAEVKMKEYEESWQKKKAKRAKIKKLKGNLNSLDQAVVEDYDVRAPPDMFSEHVLNKDPKLSASLTYDSLYYPKAFGHEKYAPESLDRFWMSAYIDRAERDAELLKKERERDIFNSLKDYSNSGGSLVAHDANSVAAPASISTSEVNEHRKDVNIKESIKRSNLLALTSDAGLDDMSSDGRISVGVHDSDIMSTSSSMYESNSLTSEQITNAVNNDPNARIKKLLDKKAMGKKPHKETLEDKLKPYNSALKAIAMSKMKKIEVAPPHSIVSLDLDKLFEHERIENEAAKRITKTWKRYKIMPKLQFAVFAMLRAVQIQKLIRGILCRKRVGRYFSFMTVLATWTQAHIRRHLSNKRLRPYLALEKMCAIRIQKVLRGKFGRLKWTRARRDLAATRIQALWRGIGARTKSDIKWLGKRVTPIQCLLRKHVTKKRVKQVRDEIYPAADKIQRCYRSYSARRRVSSLLFDREMRYREDVVTNLQAEEEWVQDKLEKVVKRFTKNNLKAEAEKICQQCEDKYEAIYMDQNMLVEINRQMQILSPRAITQGWYLTLNKKAYDLRNELTQKKIGCIFGDLAKVLQMDDRLERSIEEIEMISDWRHKLGKQRDIEYAERRERFYYRDLRARRLAERRAIANERRKWTVKFFTSDGKPDKRRRPGKPWDSAIFSKPEKMTYSAVDGVHLFANDMNKHKVTKPGSVESVNDTMGKMALQTYLDQVNHYEQILNPISDIMRKFISPVPEMKTDNRTGRTHQINKGSSGRGIALEKELVDANRSIEIAAWDLAPAKKEGNGGDYIRSSVSRGEGGGGSDDVSSQWSSQIDESSESRDVCSSKSDNGGRGNNQLVLGKPNNYGLLTAKEISRREELQKEKERKQEEARRMDEAIRLRAERTEARRKRLAGRREEVAIPWALLDQLEGEKRRFESDVAFAELYKKF